VFANSFDGPEGLALVEVLDLFLVRCLVPLWFVISLDYFCWISL
jgi:hypothetical protein